MNRRIALSVIVLAAAGVAGGGDQDKSKTKPAVSKADRSYGTCLQWESELDVAAKKATREKKLLMVLAVAGHFEDPFFT
jgi:hypothetical protein